jgi:hypothetical protein
MQKIRKVHVVSEAVVVERERVFKFEHELDEVKSAMEKVKRVVENSDDTVEKYLRNCELRGLEWKYRQLAMKFSGPERPGMR